MPLNNRKMRHAKCITQNAKHNTPMKRNIYYISLALGSLTLMFSCSQENIPDSNPHDLGIAITFSMSLQEDLSTRGTPKEESDMHEFYVTAISNGDSGDVYFKDCPFSDALSKTTSDNKRIFTSSEGYIWPVTDLEFFAYYNKPEGASFAFTEDGYVSKDFKIDPDISKHTDFVSAYQTKSYTAIKPDDNDVSTVDLQFHHQLSQIKVEGLKAAGSTYEFEIAGVRIGNPNAEGTFNFRSNELAGEWKDTNTGNVFYIFAEDDIIPQLTTSAGSFMGKGGSAMVIPTTNEAWEGTTATKKWSDNKEYATEQSYLSVLVRVTENTKNVIYPYPEGKDKYSSEDHPMDVVRFLVGADNKIIKMVDKDYVASPDETVKEFGWAAIPIEANWKAGKRYLYTLTYSNEGIGLHDPEDPAPGTPIGGEDSTDIRVTVTVQPWKDATAEYNPTINVPYE